MFFCFFTELFCFFFLQKEVPFGNPRTLNFNHFASEGPQSEEVSQRRVLLGTGGHNQILRCSLFLSNSFTQSNIESDDGLCFC